jgi:hypothetical protein
VAQKGSLSEVVEESLEVAVLPAAQVLLAGAQQVPGKSYIAILPFPVG